MSSKRFLNHNTPIGCCCCSYANTSLY
jgi:hypothetical protein